MSEIGADAAQIAEVEKLRASGYDKTLPKEYCENVLPTGEEIESTLNL